MNHHYGDDHDDATKPDSPDAILANATLQFVEGARNIGISIPLLCRLADSEREHFASCLADDIIKFAKRVEGFAELVRFTGR